jgi:hypothetical protein
MNGSLRGDEFERALRAGQEPLPRCFRVCTSVTLDPSTRRASLLLSTCSFSNLQAAQETSANAQAPGFPVA